MTTHINVDLNNVEVRAILAEHIAHKLGKDINNVNHVYVREDGSAIVNLTFAVGDEFMSRVDCLTKTIQTLGQS